MNLYPLKFEPRYVEKMWGGRKLQTVLARVLPTSKPVGESWEIYDFPPGVIEGSTDWVSAKVANGPLRGKTIHELIERFGDELLGSVSPMGSHRQFPLLIKYLDAREDLSVQVHPDQNYASRHPEAHLKSEAWYVVQTDAGARILKGLALGVNRESFQQGIAGGTVEGLIKSIPAKVGACHYLPSGTIHALGAGILAAEVQTPSDTTFRVFDFNRVDPGTGQLRKLHVEQALDCIDFSGAPEIIQQRSHVGGIHTTVTRLVACDYFIIEKVRMTEGIEESIPYDEPVIWMMLEGSAEVRVNGMTETTKIARGETVLLPAGMKNPVIRTLADTVWLEITLP